MQISKLADLLEHADRVARWIWDEWREHSGLSLEATRARLLAVEDCPPALLAHLADEPAGVLGFRRFRRAGELKRSLFVDALYVHPRFRGQGVGSALIEAGALAACAHDSRLFAYTDKRAWYEKRGFRVIASKLDTDLHVLARTLRID